MNFHAPRMVLFALFAFAAAGSVSATPATNPWPTPAEMSDRQPVTLLAHDDRDWHDDRWHDRREDWRRENWRREQWRREQARREAERRWEWERRHERAHRYEDDHRYYRR